MAPGIYRLLILDFFLFGRKGHAIKFSEQKIWNEEAIGFQRQTNFQTENSCTWWFRSWKDNFRRISEMWIFEKFLLVELLHHKQSH